jgi:hypothetical protein
MPDIKKKRVAVDIDDETFIALRKLLFAHGIKIGEFFNCIAEKACTNQDIILTLINDTVEFKQEKIASGKLTKGVDAKTLYKLIEDLNSKKAK